MGFATVARSRYSRAETVSDAAVHVAGLSLVLLAAPALIVVTVQRDGGLAAVVGVSIYAGALMAMIFFSALYNMTSGIAWGAAWEWLLKRLDHSAIYVKIAGTYTPFTLLSGQGLWLTVALWGVAAAGVALKIVSPDRLRWLALGLYLGMGWAGIVAGQALLAALPGPVLLLMGVGGALYTLGVGFYLWESLPFHNTIWHIFVLLASFAFYAAVLVLVLVGAADAV